MVSGVSGMARFPKSVVVAMGLVCGALTSPALAASCGDTSAGFETWKTEFAKTARKAGVGKRGLQALAQSQYATRTIAADRNQKSFKYSLEKFMQVRGADTIVAQGRKRKARNPGFYAALEQQYGSNTSVARSGDFLYLTSISICITRHARVALFFRQSWISLTQK